ncbi:rhodanese-like domain-containing protein [Fuchsiella alkaliacetigena]|uniref:rhodanese-like domain-containing protein n=1 Tax=Fuchsiella alkaliacetigena TaxID=957042 RepID=UPI00200B432E|nr:rhodanese-like domain-containing protein [Fuchsiella alkaliacetigena]MCK8825474.1 rhodanese-like domain-containing protein [Fuchsiella alkaliacetigena]
MRKKLTVLLVCLLIVALAAPGAFALRDQYDEEIEYITPMDLEFELEMSEIGEDIVVIDVRTEDEFQAGHIPGSVRVDGALLGLRIDDHADEDTKVVITCLGGGRAIFSTKLVQDLGYDVYNLEGGFRAWAQEGYPVQTDHGIFTLEEWE